jgi:hypothetical protein
MKTQVEFRQHTAVSEASALVQALMVLLARAQEPNGYVSVSSQDYVWES